MTLDELKATAATIVDEINTILGEVKPEDFSGEAVNWADLMCTGVSIVLTDDPISWEAVVEEAAPGCFRLGTYLHDELYRRGRYDVWIRTEW